MRCEMLDTRNGDEERELWIMDYRPNTACHVPRLPIANRKPYPSGVAMLVCIWLTMLAGLVQAQPAPVSGSKYYVWGQVRSPGAYSFVASPDLLELLSAAGGPTENANLQRVILIQAVAQKRTRINLQTMLDKGQVVRLSPGDVLLVPSSPWYYVRNALEVLTTAAGFVTLYFTVLTWAGK